MCMTSHLLNAATELLTRVSNVTMATMLMGMAAPPRVRSSPSAVTEILTRMSNVTMAPMLMGMAAPPRVRSSLETYEKRAPRLWTRRC